MRPLGLPLIAATILGLLVSPVAAAIGDETQGVTSSSNGNRIEVTVSGWESGGVRVGRDLLAGCTVVAGLTGAEVLDLAGGRGIVLGITNPEMASSDASFVFMSCRNRVLGAFDWTVWEQGEPIPDEVIDAVARAARAAIEIPHLEPQAAPDGLDVPFLTQLPVWLWVPSSSWVEQTATASLPEIGLWVTATASPVETRWQTGADGPELTCGPGTPWSAGRPDTDATCATTYTSVTEPGETIQLSVTTSFDVGFTCTPVVCDPADIDLGGVDVTSARPVTVTTAVGLVTR